MKKFTKLKDIVGDGQELLGVEVFIDSLTEGELKEALVSTVSAVNVEILFNADKQLPILIDQSFLLRLDEAIEQFPEVGVFYFWKGLRFRQNAKFKEALSCFLKAISFRCSHWRIYWYAAEIFFAGGNFEKAHSYVSEALKYAPEFGPALEIKEKLFEKGFGVKRVAQPDKSGEYYAPPEGVQAIGLKVVHLCTLDTGGASTAAYRLHKSLQAEGVDSKMLVMSKRRNDDSVVSPIQDFEGKQLWDALCSSWNFLAESYPQRPEGLEIFTDTTHLMSIEDCEEIKHADIVNMHWVTGLIDYETLPEVLKDKVVVWTLHDMNPFTGGCHYSEDCINYKAKCSICPQLGSVGKADISQEIWEKKRKCYEKLDIQIVSPSKWLASCAAESELFSRYTVENIPYGSAEHIYTKLNPDTIRDNFNIKENDFFVLFGAQSQTVTRKGFTYFIDMLNKLDGMGVDNIVVGIFGWSSESVEKLIPYRVIRFGSVGDEKKLALIYSMANAYVIPTLEDNLPNTVLEAMACGIPVVGFNTGGVPDMIIHKKTGWLAPVKDSEQLAAGIRWLKEMDHEKRDRISYNCRSVIRKNFSMKKQAKTYIDLYKRLLSKKEN